MRNLALLCLLVILVAGCVSIPTNSTTPPKNDTPTTPPINPPVTPPVTPPITPKPPVVQPEPAPEPECVLNKDCGMFDGCVNGKCTRADSAFINSLGASFDIQVKGCTNQKLEVHVTNQALHPMPISLVIMQDGNVIGSLDEGKWQDGDSIQDWTVQLIHDYTPSSAMGVDTRFRVVSASCDSAVCNKDKDNVCHVNA
jgi:hypothetical protein